MKKTPMFLITAFLVTLYFSAKATTPLIFNLENGKAYKIRSISHQIIQQSANGQAMNVEMTTNSLISFSQIKKENDVMFIEIKIDSLSTTTSSPAGKADINFNKPAKSGDHFSLIMNRFCEFKITAKISTSGKFLSFTNYQDFKDSVMIILETVPAAKKDQVKAQAESILKESLLQSMAEPLFAYLPEKDVNTGDKWETSYVQASEQASMVMFNTFTLNSIENGKVNISGSTEVESIPSNEVAKAGAPQISMDAKGTSLSELIVDQSTGLILKNSSKGHTDGTLMVKNQGQEMKIILAVDSQTESILIE